MGTYATYGQQADDQIGTLTATVAARDATIEQLQARIAELESQQPPTPISGKTFAVWHHTWAGARLRDYPADVKAACNLVILAMAQGPGDGTVGYYSGNGQSDADHAADIRAFEAAGIRVSLGVGGAGDPTKITTTAQANNFVASVAALQAKFGFSGIDIDLEPGDTSQWSETALVSALRQLRAKFPGFLVGLTGSLWGPYTARWVSLAKALGADLSYLASMNYDIPESTDSRLTSVVLSRTASLLQQGIPLDKQILGFMPQPYPGYNASPPAVIEAAFRAVKQQYPTIKGAFVWEDKIEAAQSWASSRRIMTLART